MIIKKPPLIIALFAVGFMIKANANSHTAVTDYTTTTVIRSLRIKSPALTVDDVLNRMVDLANDGNILNLKKSAIALGAYDITSVPLRPIAKNDTISYIYHNHDNDYPIASITHRMSVGWFLDIELTQVHKSVNIDFKPQFCPSISQLKDKFGDGFQSWEVPISPDLVSGKGGSYTTYHIITKKYLIFIENDGCQFNVVSKAKFG
ncbi:MAG: hypothetical protein Q3971_04690 [Moraxella sp.]|nr:hypothetical protein [Moraxella sp.]